jgi:Glycosyltransferase family 87
VNKDLERSRRGAALSYLFVFLSLMFGAPAWLTYFTVWNSEQWQVGDVGVWAAAWRIVLGGRTAELFQTAAFRAEFVNSDIGRHAPANMWLFPPQHAVLSAPLGLMSLRSIYLLIVMLNIATWWWMLRSMASFAAEVSPQYWNLQRRRILIAVGFLFVPAATSAVNAAFSCLICAAIWFVLLDALRSKDYPVSPSREWLGAGILFCASIKPQMILLTLLGLMLSAGYGRSVVKKTLVLVIGTTAITAWVFGWRIYLDWVHALREASAGRLGSPFYVWWSPAPILSHRFMGGKPPSLPIAVGTLLVSIAIVFSVWSSANSKSRLNRDEPERLNPTMAAAAIGPFAPTCSPRTRRTTTQLWLSQLLCSVSLFIVAKG